MPQFNNHIIEEEEEIEKSSNSKSYENINNLNDYDNEEEKSHNGNIFDYNKKLSSHLDTEQCDIDDEEIPDDDDIEDHSLLEKY